MCNLYLFGAPRLKCSNRFQQIQRRKARALLAYLAVTQQSHSREALAALLWPEHDHRTARADLSRMLSGLRNILGAGCFLSDRDRVALNDEALLWVDVLHFRKELDACRGTPSTALSDDCCQNLEAAVELYQADFLAGFTLPDSPAFDEWQLLQSEDLRRDLGWALDKLIHAYDERNDLPRAIVYAQRWVRLDPLHETAQRRLISLYASNGQRAEAHHQYRACVRVLKEELGVEPQLETKQLYEQIRRSTTALSRKLKYPSYDDGGMDTSTSHPESIHPFVERAGELERLNGYLDEARVANGQVVFITGGAGRGKTSLLEEFARRAQAAQPDLIVAGGSGKAFAGNGDPYLPFREVMSQLTGDVSTQRASGQMSGEQRRRLWALLTFTTQVILEHGPQLLDVFVSGKQLLARAATTAPPGEGWLSALQAEVTRRQEAPGAFEQRALYGQFTNVLYHLAQKHPLLITLDDLQWIDEASIGLLFHFARRLAGHRILIVGAYRPDELPTGRNGEPHALAQVLDELKRTYGDVFIDLAWADQVGGRAFVDAFLDTEPNRLDTGFRQALFDRTGGHPLFTVELLRDMQSRGDLVKDQAGYWREGSQLDWETFPARIEAVIARRIDRMDDATRAILEVASVEGEQFTAEVVSRVLGMKDRALLNILSQQLGKRHRLVQEKGEIRVGRDYLSSYRFSHALFREYLYLQLSTGERRRLHGEVAEALGSLFAADPDRVVVQLANHTTSAGLWNEAVAYLEQAGDLARQKASLPDAVRHYQSALAHWPEADLVGKAQILLKLGECLWSLGQHQKAVETLQSSYDLFQRSGQNYGAGAAKRLLGRVYWELGEPDKAGQSYQQALAILEREPESEELAWALAGMSGYYMQLSDYDGSIELGERALAMARRLGAETIIIECLCDLGSTLSGKGDWGGLAMEQESLERALALNRPHDAGRAYLYISEALIYLGRYEQARSTLKDAIAYTRRMHVPYITEGAARQLAELDWITGRWQDAIAQFQPGIEHAEGEGPAGLSRVYLNIALGRYYNDLGQSQAAYKLLAEAQAGTVNTLDPRIALLGEMARAEATLGQAAAAASKTAEILEWIDQAGYLYPNVGMALLLICRLPVAFGLQAMLGAARSAQEQLERLDRQYSTPVTAAFDMEGRGWLNLAQADPAKAVVSFEQAAALWQNLGHPYDHARALSGLGRALIQSGDEEGAKSASKAAMGLIDSLAAQLEDRALKTSFLDSLLVQEIRGMMGGTKEQVP